MYVRSTNRNQKLPEAAIGESCLVLRKMGVHQKVNPSDARLQLVFTLMGLCSPLTCWAEVHHAELTIHADLSWVNTTLYIWIWLWIRSVGWDSGAKNHCRVNREKKRHDMQIRHGVCRTNCWPFIRGSCVCSLQPQIMWIYMKPQKK